jgi:hypothetical protein
VNYPNAGAYVVEYNNNPQPVPEPASLAVWSLLAIAGIGYGSWRKRRSA